jgi:CheY-like chemotaxis protein
MKDKRLANILMADATQSMASVSLILLDLNMPKIDKRKALELLTSDSELMIEITRMTRNY